MERITEARVARAAALEARSADWLPIPATGAFAIPSASEPGNYHTASRESCSCLGFHRLGYCRHHDAVALYLWHREGAA